LTAAERALAAKKEQERRWGLDDGPTAAPYLEVLTERVDLLPYFRMLWDHRKFLRKAAVVGFVASALIAVLIPSRYRAITRLMPPDNQSVSGLGILAAISGKGAGLGASSSLSNFGGLAGDLLGVKSSGALFVGIVGSQTVQDRLIEEFDLRRHYWDSKIEDARTDLAEHTDVSEERKSGIITIGVTDHDPQRAATMARAYVTELDRLVAQVSTSSARRERIFLEDRLKTVKTDLDTAAKNFSNFASKNTAIDIPAQGKAMVEAAANLQGRLIAAQAELSGLQQIYTNNNVRVRAAEARVAELQKKLNELGGGASEDTQDVGALYPSIRKLPILGVTYADLFLKTKIQETVFEMLTQQYELAKVQEAKEIPSVKVLDVATTPTKRSFPPRILLTIFGTLMGLAAAMAWVILRQKWNAVDSGNPRKMFATEVFTTFRASLPAFARNGHTASSNGDLQRHWQVRSANEKELDREGGEPDEI
jgi:uncharacterized protein involved in exopolysaccharide biosynthesis